jgi:hypothetical protein
VVLEPSATICADAKLVGANRTPTTTSRKTRTIERFIFDPPYFG